MRKFLYSALIVFFCLSLANAGMIIRVLGSLTCTDNAIDCSVATSRSSWSISTVAHQNYQEMPSEGAEITICQIDVTMEDDTTSGNVHLEIWNVGFTTQYGSDSNSVLINNDSSQVEYNFTFATNPVVPSGDFRVEFVREDNAVRLWGTSVETCTGTTAEEMFTFNTERNRDAIMTIHTMQ